MSAKLLQAFSDESPDLQKQIGCMSSIFQMFDRHHLLTGRRLNHKKLTSEVDQPGSHIDNYVTQLSFVLSRKAAGLVSLQARLTRFQHRLKEHEILSRKNKVLR